MMRSGLGVMMVLLAATAAQAKLEIQNIQAAYGLLGPERKSLEAIAGDEVLFRFNVNGIKLDAKGQVDALLAIKLTNANGDVLLANDSPLKTPLGLGGDSFPANARINLSEKTAPGEYTLTITVTDNQSSEKASFQRKVTCKPVEFALVAPEFFYDPEHRIAAPSGGRVGQILFFRMRGIGIDRSQDKLSTSMTLQVIDKDGKDVLPQAITAEVKNEDPQVVRKVPFVTYRAHLFLNRTGDFTLRVSVTDNIAKKTAKYESPLHVTGP